MIERPTVPKALKKAAGQQYLIGPTPGLYKDMMRQIMLNRWALDQKGVLNDDSTVNKLDGDTIVCPL